MAFTRLVDQWRGDRERGDLVIGREGSAKMDVALSTPGEHTRDPQRAQPDAGSRPGVFGRVAEMFTGSREPELDEEPEA